VFLNLAVNAAQAMPEGQAERNEIRVITRRGPGGDVVVEFKDTGAGIPEAVLPRIFDPFFTTKEVGVGTGLGLAICHRIVSGFGGQIGVESEVGRGTTFRISLPVASIVVEPRADAAPRPAPPPRRGRILVVDDEPMMCHSVRRILARDHDVETTTSGSDALARVARGERYDVILCDLMMPVLGGADVYDELRKSAPEQAAKMVFMTGGAFTPRAQRFLDEVPNARVEKPLQTSELRALVHAQLLSLDARTGQQSAAWRAA
jgi:CheY-like chemotaxis protein